MYRVSQLIGKKVNEVSEMMKEISNIVSVANEWVTETPFQVAWSRVNFDSRNWPQFNFAIVIVNKFIITDRSTITDKASQKFVIILTW